MSSSNRGGVIAAKYRKPIELSRAALIARYGDDIREPRIDLQAHKIRQDRTCLIKHLIDLQST